LFCELKSSEKEKKLDFPPLSLCLCDLANRGAETQLLPWLNRELEILWGLKHQHDGRAQLQQQQQQSIP
jgi:hypothetical protein